MSTYAGIQGLPDRSFWEHRCHTSCASTAPWECTLVMCLGIRRPTAAFAFLPTWRERFTVTFPPEPRCAYSPEPGPIQAHPALLFELPASGHIALAAAPP